MAKPKSDREMTPVPSSDLVTWTHALTRIDTGVRAIKEDTLPPIAESAKTASEGVIQLKVETRELKTRVTRIEESPNVHSCTQEERISGIEKDSSSQGNEVKSLSTWRYWLAGTILMVVVAVSGGVIKAYADLAAVRTNVTRNGQDLTRHETLIKEKMTKQVIETDNLISEVKELTNEVRKNGNHKQVQEDQTPRINVKRLSRRERKMLEGLMLKAMLEDQ